jgi:NADPH-dependent ferric siderophore reductase
LAGPDLERFVFQGFDQWFRLVLPQGGGDESLARMPDRFDTAGYLRYLRLPKAIRPTVRSYTVRAWRPGALELDVDFIQHGDAGVAGPWAAAAQPGAPAGLIDQGRGFRPEAGRVIVLVGDATALPAIAGILRDLPPTARGVALLELADPADRQDLPHPPDLPLRWLDRADDAAPGVAALTALRSAHLDGAQVQAFAAGEAGLATGARRLLVGELSVPKNQITFCGYWKRNVS